MTLQAVIKASLQAGYRSFPAGVLLLPGCSGEDAESAIVAIQTAYSLFSPFLRRHIYELVKPRKPTSCATVFKTLAPGEPPIADTRREATEVDADSLRIAADTGFLFFNAKTDGHKLIVVDRAVACERKGASATSSFTRARPAISKRSSANTEDGGVKAPLPSAPH